MRAASTQVLVERRNELVARRLLVIGNERRSSHQDPGKTIAALPGLKIHDRLLQRMHVAGRAKALNCCDRLPFHGPRRRLAGLHRAAVNQDRASAALSDTASEAHAFESKIVAQNVEQGRLVVIDGHFVFDAIDVQMKEGARIAGHISYRTSAPQSAPVEENR